MTHYAHIQNEAAYERAIQARIKANRRTGAYKRWLAANEDGERLNQWLNGTGEFAPKNDRDERCVEVLDSTNTHVEFVEHCFVVDGRDYRCKCRWVYSPVGKLANTPFLIKLRDQLEEWGSLSEKQTQAVRDSLSRAEGKVVQWAAEREQQVEADRASSQHIGTVGERREFDLKVERTFSFEGQFGETFINICRDADQNVIVYKGSKPFERGADIRVKATIKAHDERDGVAQTLIARPTII